MKVPCRVELYSRARLDVKKLRETFPISRKHGRIHKERQSDLIASEIIWNFARIMIFVAIKLKINCWYIQRFFAIHSTWLAEKNILNLVKICMWKHTICSQQFLALTNAILVDWKKNEAFSKLTIATQ